DIVAAAWGILAFGDGMATLVGRRIGGRPWPWNHEKTIAGTIAFAVCGGLGAVALACWTRPAIAPLPSWQFEIVAPLAAAIVAALIGIAIYAGAGRNAWLLLLVAFAIASVASRLGLKRKVLLGIEEERGGRRGGGNAVANCGVATIAALAASATPHSTTALVALVAALTAGGSDTVASEIGKAWGRSTFLVTTLSRVKPGRR